MKSSAYCLWCKNTLSSNHIGACPKCGKEGKHITVMPDPINVKVKAIMPSIAITEIKEFYKKNNKVLFPGIVICVIMAVITFFIIGILGIITSIVLGILFFLYYPAWKIRIREVKEEKHIFKEQS